MIETWRRHFNEVRPHSSLGYLTPAEFVARLKQQVAASRPAGPLRYVGPPRSDPLHHRPARGKRRKRRGQSSQTKRGPKKLGRSLPSDRDEQYRYGYPDETEVNPDPICVSILGKAEDLDHHPQAGTQSQSQSN